MSAPICFVDTETDGLHPDRKVWEVAIIRVDGDDRTEWSAFATIDLSTADPAGLRVGRFYERHPWGRWYSGRTKHVERAPHTSLLSQEEIATEVAQRTHGAHIVGAVPNFDTEVLARLLREHGIAPAWHYHLIDVENLAAGRLAALGDFPELPWDSDELTRRLGLLPVDDDARHTALGDARWAEAIYWSCTSPNRRRTSEYPHPAVVIDRVREHLEDSHATKSLPSAVEAALIAAQREASTITAAQRS